MTPKRFLITGVSSGLGLAFARAALDAGHSVVGKLRNEAARLAFEALHPERARAFLLDVTDFAAVGPLGERIEREVGAIAVLVNNAGYGHEGTVEESPLDELTRQFGVNVFGAVALVEAEQPPVHLLLGTDALALAKSQLEARLQEIAAWEHLTRSTNSDG